MKKVDLNVDIGEGFPYDEALLEFATSANVCCGEHAGSRELTLATVELCSRRMVRLGCHPGFPDRNSLGRRAPDEDEIMRFAESVAGQVNWFLSETRAAYVKPHGALYSVLSSPATYSGAVYGACIGLIGGIALKGYPIMMLPHTGFVTVLKGLGRTVIAEGFADRRYQPDNSLVPRSEPDAVLQDPKEIKDQVLRLAPKVDSICLHGDTPNCLELAELVKRTLVDAGYEVGY